MKRKLLNAEVRDKNEDIVWYRKWNDEVDEEDALHITVHIRTYMYIHMYTCIYTYLDTYMYINVSRIAQDDAPTCRIIKIVSLGSQI